MELFDRSKIRTLPLESRMSKSNIEKILVNPSDSPKTFPAIGSMDRIAEEIINSRRNNRPVILAYGAHLIKNGLSPILIKLVEEGFVTHLATNGAGAIHDWEFAYHGKTEEDVRKYAALGQFGIWEETGKFQNLALICGAAKGKGYGESLGEMINREKLVIPRSKNEKLAKAGIKPGVLKIKHPFKQYSILNAAYANNVPLTIHPGFGYDIIYTHPLSDGAAVGKCSEIDFLAYAKSVSQLEGGAYLSIGSAIMSPMIFEKSLSMARNVARQEGKKIDDFMIVVNDIQEGNWNWGSGKEPEKTDPAYYLRFCKTFDRMGSREMHYIEAHNKDFLLSLYQKMKNKI
jgi:hypothetical protein